ncbi:pentapeptide repeat protein [Lentzea atacamensis]|uniref:Pentapeptide repeat protein n=1 Tax=Lentzea atacamensis TaxID=531938 RepID=A0A316I1S8_9PSEU|nr:pentapeptide repeat-containing protein [Lentzea atacamensis]PWK86293.1 pentapeptide repeat protein [Lentzea atacamensis]
MTSARGTALSNRAIALIGLLLLVIAATCTTVLLWQFGDDRPATRSRLEALKVAGTIVVAAGGLVALWLAARKQRSTELEFSRQLQADEASQLDAAERRITELYTKAADQLGSDKAPVRLAGLYALERVGIGAPDQRATIMNVICAYLRMPNTPPDPRANGEDDTYERRLQEQQVRVTAQRIVVRHLSTLLDADGRNDNRWQRINVDLTNADLQNADLGQTDLTDAAFAEADLSGARLTSSILAHAKFTNATLVRADLSNAQALRAQFTNADLSGANLSGATLSDADFRGARLTGADLSHANLRGADFTDADLTGAVMDDVVK